MKIWERWNGWRAERKRRAEKRRMTRVVDEMVADWTKDPEPPTREEVRMTLYRVFWERRSGLYLDDLLRRQPEVGTMIESVFQEVRAKRAEAE